MSADIQSLKHSVVSKSTPELNGLIEEAITRGALKQCSQTDVKVCLPAFTVPKSDGGHRLIYDARYLNSKCQLPLSFEVLTIPIALQNSPWGSVCGKIDLKHAFWQVGLSSESQSLFGLRIGDTYYRWQVLPFGFSWSPLIFSAVLSEILEAARNKHPDLKVFEYLDDILVVGDKTEFGQKIMGFAQTLKAYGVILNDKKSELRACNSTSYLGFFVSPGLHRLQITKVKARKTRRVLRSVKETHHLQGIQSILGKLRHLSMGIPEIAGIIRRIPFWIYGMFRKYRLDPTRKKDWKTVVPIPMWIRTKFKICAHILTTTERRFCGLGQPNVCVLDADATPTHWGGCIHTRQEIQHLHFRGRFQGKKRPIAERELMATILSTLSAQKIIQGRSVIFRTDNLPVFWILTKGCSQNPRLNALCLLWWMIIRKWEIAPCIQWIPTEQNFYADHLSRNKLWVPHLRSTIPLSSRCSKISWLHPLDDFIASSSKTLKKLAKTSIRFLKRCGCGG